MSKRRSARELALKVLGMREFNRLTPGRWIVVGVSPRGAEAVLFKLFDSDRKLPQRASADGAFVQVLAFMTP